MKKKTTYPAGAPALRSSRRGSATPKKPGQTEGTPYPEPNPPFGRVGGSGIGNIVLLWLAWVLIVIGFQALAAARLQPQRPDMLMWYPGDPTDINFYQKGHPYLLEPFMNNQAWVDSEFYLGIAVGGYDDPCMMSMYRNLQGSVVPCTNTKYPSADLADGETIPVSYAFFPFYPILIRLFSIPLSLLQLNPIATATLAGVIVSALGILAAMLALYDLTREDKALGEDGGMRAVFYLLIFPTSFYFVQVYTEGLFVGLAFTCLAMLKRKHLALAALLAGAATITRPVGVALVIPMAILWVRTYKPYALALDWGRLDFKRLPWRLLLWHALLAFTPLIVFLTWQFSYYGAVFHYIETNMFGRPPLDIGKGFTLWTGMFNRMISGFFHLPNAYGEIASPQISANYFVEFSCMAIGFIAILRCLKSDPEVAWFSLAVFLIPLVSGPPGIHRYVLAAPALFITLARWGKNPVFDRAWTFASLLVMGLLAMLFAFNFWVA